MGHDEPRLGAAGRVLTHTGSNTMHYAVAWMAPLRDFAVLIVTNEGGNGVDRAVRRGRPGSDLAAELGSAITTAEARSNLTCPSPSAHANSRS
jgi:hypothetical protein